METSRSMESKDTHNYNPTYLLLPTQQITVHEENMLITALLVVKTVRIVQMSINGVYKMYIHAK